MWNLSDFQKLNSGTNDSLSLVEPFPFMQTKLLNVVDGTIFKCEGREYKLLPSTAKSVERTNPLLKKFKEYPDGTIVVSVAPILGGLPQTKLDVLMDVQTEIIIE